jgi:hypothetical protein
MGGETLTPQRCIPNMKTIPSKLWSVISGNQTVSGGGGGDGTKTKVSPTSSGDTINQWLLLEAEFNELEGKYSCKYGKKYILLNFNQPF